MLIGALDELLERTDAQYGVDVFGKHSWRIAPDIESECRQFRWRICTTDAKDNLISRGGEVRLRATIRGSGNYRRRG